jgi:hypothetical protein
MNERNDCDNKWPALRDALREALPSELDSDTIYEPAVSRLGPKSNTIPEESEPERDPSLLAILMQLLIPPRRPAR